MNSPAPDLSRLRINRDAVPAGPKRALRWSALIGTIAVLFVATLLVVLRRGAAIAVRVALAEVVGGAGGAGGAGGGTTGITANGYVVARTKASVSSKITGRLEYLGVTEGSYVRQGQVLARLESGDYAAALAQAEAEVGRARAELLEAETQRDQLRRDLTRAQDLFARNLLSPQDVENAQAALAAAEARVRAQAAAVDAVGAAVGVARASLENTSIRAPFNGTVLRKDAEVGEVVAPVAPGGGLTRGAVVTMADLTTLEVEVDVNEAYIAQIRNGQPARITLDAYPDTSYRGRVRQIVPTADRQRATVLVKVSILDRDSRILPEMGSRVEFIEYVAARAAGTPAAPPRIFVPAAAVRDDAGRQIVWVVRDGRVERREVDAGPATGGRREVRRGLAGGEQIVVDAPGSLRDGARVTVTAG